MKICGDFIDYVTLTEKGMDKIRFVLPRSHRETEFNLCKTMDMRLI